MSKIEEMSVQYAERQVDARTPERLDRHTKNSFDVFDGYDIRNTYESGANAVLEEIEKECRRVAKGCKEHVDNPVDEENRIDSWTRLDEMEYMLKFVQELKGE